MVFNAWKKRVCPLAKPFYLKWAGSMTRTVTLSITLSNGEEGRDCLTVVADTAHPESSSLLST